MFTLAPSLTNYEDDGQRDDSELAHTIKNGRMAMMRLLVEEIGSGLHPSEVIVSVTVADGSKERLVVSRRSLSHNSIPIGWPITEDGDRVLVELPRETQTGAWRVWVKKDRLIEEERMRA
jgi:hypothetical protein